MTQKVSIDIGKLGNEKRRLFKTRISAARCSFTVMDQRALPDWPEDDRFRDVIAGQKYRTQK